MKGKITGALSIETADMLFQIMNTNIVTIKIGSSGTNFVVMYKGVVIQFRIVRKRRSKTGSLCISMTMPSVKITGEFGDYGQLDYKFSSEWIVSNKINGVLDLNCSVDNINYLRESRFKTNKHVSNYIHLDLDAKYDIHYFDIVPSFDGNDRGFSTIEYLIGNTIVASVDYNYTVKIGRLRIYGAHDINF